MELEMDKYKFNPEEAYGIIARQWSQWADAIGAKKWVIGISGGKDSTVVAELAARIFGKENVIVVMMPNGEQKDISDSIAVCEVLNIPIMNVEKVLSDIRARVHDWRLDEGSTISMPIAANRLEEIANDLEEAIKEAKTELYDALRRSTTRLHGVCDCYPELRGGLKEQIEENLEVLGEKT